MSGGENLDDFRQDVDFHGSCAMPPSSCWTQAEACQLARLVEEIAPEADCHVALTGGCLYKGGLRKDVDLMFYRIRQRLNVDRPKLKALLTERLGFVWGRRCGWVHKATYRGKDVDCFFPELAEEWDGVGDPAAFGKTETYGGGTR